MESLLERLRLRAGEGRIIVTGIATRGCVQCAVMGFSIRDFYVYVPIDCTTQREEKEKLQAFSLFNSFGYRYNVTVTRSDLIQFSRSTRPQVSCPDSFNPFPHPFCLPRKQAHENNPYSQALDFGGDDPGQLNRPSSVGRIDGSSRSQNRLHINEHQCFSYRICSAQGFPPGIGTECRDDCHADELDHECLAHPWDRLWYACNFCHPSRRQRFAGEGGGGIDRPSRLFSRCKKRI